MPNPRITSTDSSEAGVPPHAPTPADSTTQPLSDSFCFSHPSAIGLRHVFPVHTTSTFFIWLSSTILNFSFLILNSLQYDFAISTRCPLGLPVKMHVPAPRPASGI